MGRPVFFIAMMVAVMTGCPRVEEVKLDASDGGASAGESSGSVTNMLASHFDGVDLLVVVDNSGSMEQEQEILSTAFFTLINSLVNPIAGPDWPFPEVENMRVAVVSSDLGLQYGEGRVDGFPYGDTNVPTCTDQDARGDDGRFQTSMPATTTITSGQIACADTAEQCPPDWSCEASKCISPTGNDEAINCSSLVQDDPFAETEAGQENPNLAAQIACLSKLGTHGCGVEQQLESSVRALTRNEEQQAFLKESHMLVVLVVSDEEDCSVADRGLFDTPEWQSGTMVNANDPAKGQLNTACNLPESNEENYLFPISRYWQKLVEMKGNQPRAVLFAAIVGVPQEEDSMCQGLGNTLNGCLDTDKMQLESTLFESQGAVFSHFAPACERTVEDVIVTSARPGRRYVRVAQEFGAHGYIYSICNEDWSPAMRNIARILAENLVEQSCFPKPLPWNQLSYEDQIEQGCEGCGTAECDVEVIFEFAPESDEGCPAAFANPAEETRQEIKDAAGNVAKVQVSCPLLKLPAPYDCDDALVTHDDPSEFGWFYCEDRDEDFGEACSDGIDNDNDGTVDCDDEQCLECLVCGDTGIGCQNSCRYSVQLTTSAKEAARGHVVSVKCP